MQLKKQKKQYIAIFYKYVVEQEFPGLHFYFLALIISGVSLLEIIPSTTTVLKPTDQYSSNVFIYLFSSWSRHSGHFVIHIRQKESNSIEAHSYHEFEYEKKKKYSQPTSPSCSCVCGRCSSPAWNLKKHIHTVILLKHPQRSRSMGHVHLGDHEKASSVDILLEVAVCILPQRETRMRKWIQVTGLDGGRWFAVATSDRLGQNENKSRQGRWGACAKKSSTLQCITSWNVKMMSSSQRSARSVVAHSPACSHEHATGYSFGLFTMNMLM